ncbi:hypothetical protein JHK84_035625 [Glycine max]|nr:hypothetical protein JHK87_035148 [Glycine soja]KAG5129228.1 hypothetical protein JHK84_035625 [Glycine max]
MDIMQKELDAIKTELSQIQTQQSAPIQAGNPNVLLARVSTKESCAEVVANVVARDPSAVDDTTMGLYVVCGASKQMVALGKVALFSTRGPNIKDFSFQEADLLKPDILAPGSLIWAAWCPNGTDEPNYVGEGFAMISGTSMAAPHIAGIAALIKQKHPHWSPVAIKSALMTTSTTLHDILYLLDRAL